MDYPHPEAIRRTHIFINKLLFYKMCKSFISIPNTTITFGKTNDGIRIYTETIKEQKMLIKIISGGQTGADRGGLIAAKKLGLQTGGCMPKGFKAHDGHHPEFIDLYGIKEHNSPEYPPRTFENVCAADGTVRFAIDFSTAGERCTLNAIKKCGKIYYDVDIIGDTQPYQLAQWIINNKISVLNVAGNSERTAKGIEEFVIAFLLETITLVNQHSDNHDIAINERRNS